MKKTQQNLRKLTLKKEVISNLQLEGLKGGELVLFDKVVIIYPEGDPPAFTYSLSWGERCNKSQKYGANNPYACGEETIKHPNG